MDIVSAGRFGGNLAQMESYLAQRSSDLAGFGDLRSDQLAQVIHYPQPQTIAQGRSVFQHGEREQGPVVVNRAPCSSAWVTASWN